MFVVVLFWDHSAAKDAKDIMEDSTGRWFSFSVNLETVFLIEKKGVSDHIAGLPFVDSPTPLQTILREMEDAGEAGVITPKTRIHLQCVKKYEEKCLFNSCLDCCFAGKNGIDPPHPGSSERFLATHA